MPVLVEATVLRIVARARRGVYLVSRRPYYGLVKMCKTMKENGTGLEGA